MTDKKKNPPSLLVGFFSFSLSVASILLAIAAFKLPFLMLPAILLFILSSSLKAFRKGILAELLSFVKLAGAFALGWYFKIEAGQLLNIKGIFSSIVGFYAIFLTIFFATGKLISAALRNHQPSLPSRLLAAFAGAFEGLILGTFTFFAMTMIPGSQLAEHQPGFLKDLTGSTEKMIAPLLPKEASNAIRAVKTMSQLSKGVDPSKIDREELLTVMQPISQIPEIQKIQNDPEIQKLIAKKDFPRLLRHPTIVKLMENPDLQGKLLGLDWKRLDKALNQGESHAP